MQTLFTPVKSQSTANVRYPRARVRVSWKKIASSGVLATVGTSLVNGLDIVAGAEGAVLPWDAYQYYDETENVLGFEYDREIIEPQGGIAAARADVILSNTNRRYSPNFNQTVGTALGPDRPLLIDAGFRLGTDRTIPVFKGSTYGDPQLDHLTRTATFRAADIISLLEDTSLSAAVYTDQRSDQIIADILASAGVGTSQYELDTGLNTIPFAWFPADMNALARIAKICEAEEASFYQDERGKVRFETRLHYKKFPHNTSQITLEKDDFVNFARLQNTRIINRCVVKANPREVDASNAVIWQEPVEIEVPGNSSKTIWARPTEPDSSVPILVYSNLAPAATTDYRAYTGSGGTGSEITADQTVTLTNFVETQKIVLANGNASKAYYNLLQFRGKAARVKEAIEAVSEDAASQTKYGVKEYIVSNDFIQTLDWAEGLADDYIAKYKDPTNRIEVAIPALPHLQLKDRVTIRDPDIERIANGAPISIEFDGVDDYVAVASNPSLDLSGGEFTQELWVYSLVTDNDYHGMIGYGQGASEDRYPSLWVYERGKIHFGFGDGTDWHGYFTNPCLGYKKWMHIAATFDGTTYKLYVNGVERHSTDAVAGKTPTGATTQFDVGRVDNYFPGRITEVRIWNKALNQGDIKKHFLDAGDVSTDFTEGVSYDVNCVCHLPMQEGAGNPEITSMPKAAWFDGQDDYIEIPDHNDFSIPTTGELTVSFWMRPDVLDFPVYLTDPEWGGYIDFLGKGDYSSPTQFEWNFRIYNKNSSRPNRVTFYVFNLSAGIGVGSYFQDTVNAGEWIHVVGKVDSTKTYIYKNGFLRDKDTYSGTITPENGTAPFRIGVVSLLADQSYFKGAIDDVKVFNRALSDSEVEDLYNGVDITSGLVAEYKFSDPDDLGKDETGNHNGTVYGAKYADDPFDFGIL